MLAPLVGIRAVPSVIPAAPPVIPAAPSVIPAAPSVILRRQESTRPAISRAPSKFTTSRPSRVATPSDIHSASNIRRSLDSCLLPLPSFLRRQNPRDLSSRARPPRSRHRVQAASQRRRTFPAPSSTCRSAGFLPAAPSVTPAPGRNPRELPSRVRPPRSRRRVQATSQRRLTSTAPSNICRSAGFLPAAPSVIPAQAGIHATCHLACALHVHEVAPKPRRNAVGHP